MIENEQRQYNRYNETVTASRRRDSLLFGHYNYERNLNCQWDWHRHVYRQPTNSEPATGTTSPSSRNINLNSLKHIHHYCTSLR